MHQTRVTICGLHPKAGRVGRSASGPDRILVGRAAKVGSEPRADLLILCCVRSQHKKSGLNEIFDAAAQQEKQPFVSDAAGFSQVRTILAKVPAF